MTAAPIRIQRKRTKAWQMPGNTVYVGRPSKWGNMFFAEHRTPLECAVLFQKVMTATSEEDLGIKIFGTGRRDNTLGDLIFIQHL
jgi:hypothetical protein